MHRILFLLFLYSAAANAQYKVQQAFTLQEMPAVVEGMTYDPVDSNFYFGEALHHRILRYTKSGKPDGYIDAAKDGMTSVLGMSVSRDHHLWICGAIDVKGKKMQCVFQYDLGNEKLIGRYPDTSGRANLFNDITITRSGSVYATDTYGRTLYKMDMKAKVAMPYLASDSLRDSNGITATGDMLYISTAKGITRVNTIDGSITMANLEHFMIAGIDGLYFYRSSLIGIQNVLFPVTVGRYYLDPRGEKIAKAEVLASGHPSFAIPTTGVVVNDEFYFMAITNIENYDLGTKQLNRGKVKAISIMKIKL